MKLIVANWKSNLNFEDVSLWVPEFDKLWVANPLKKIQVVVCPSFLSLPLVKERLSIPVEVGSQDISPFGKGSYTGEVSGESLKCFVSYAIVGHSERRRYFNEGEKTVYLKTEMCRRNGINPIVCISKISELSLLKDLDGAIIAYEPLEAIGSGKADSPENIKFFVKNVLAINSSFKVLYGGSVSPDNVESIMRIEGISGVLVGTASIHVSDFFKICQVCDNL